MGLLLGLAKAAREVHVLPPVASARALFGAAGMARTALTPDGVVHINGELWSATLLVLGLLLAFTGPLPTIFPKMDCGICAPPRP